MTSFSSGRTMLLAAAVLLAAGGGAWLHLHLLHSRDGRIEALQRQKAELEARIEQRRGEVDLTPLRRKLAQRESALIDQHRIGALLRDLGADMDDLEMSQRSLTTAAPEAFGPVRRVPLNMAFTGSFTSTFELLSRLGEHDRILRVEQLTIRRDPRFADRSEEVTVSARLLSFARTGGEEP